jgi:malonyl-CoA decarboxylase
VNVSFLQELLNTVAERGRQLLPWALGGADDDIVALSRALISGRGEASGVAIARQILNCYRSLGAEERRVFFEFLSEGMQPEASEVASAANAYLKMPTPRALQRLQAAVESPRQEFFRRLNLAPGATAEIVALRHDLLRMPKSAPGIEAIDADLMHLLGSWFNRGFLVLRRIDWHTPAVILDKIIAYEAVHEIQGWDDLRRRLDPNDRRCFAFFHPSLVDEPLIFVEVALTRETPEAISRVLQEETKSAEATPPTTAVFYSISNCQEGLRGISFGNFLIKQVVEELAREVPSLKTFVTLSPVPQFARWLEGALAEPDTLTQADREALARLGERGWPEAGGEEQKLKLKGTLLGLAAHYFLLAKSGDGRPVDAVARFHLGNGARLERINWLGDRSERGLREAHGLMVNYRYELRQIERNHEAYVNEGEIATSRSVRALLKGRERARVPQDQVRLPLPEPATEAGERSERA